MANELSLHTRSQSGKWWPIQDAQEVVMTTNVQGFYDLKWKLLRQMGFAWEDIAVDNQVYLKNARGDVAWHGRMESIEPRLENTDESINCTALGYWNSAYDLNFNGSLTGGSPEYMIGQLVSGGVYIPQLITDTNGLTYTGKTGQNYQTPNGGTDDVWPGDAILTLCDRGDIYQNKIIPSVWENRRLVTHAVSMSNPVARYSVSKSNIVSIGLRRALSTVNSRVVLRYKDSNGLLKRYVADDTTLQTNLGIDLTGGGTLTPFVKVNMMDITGFEGGTSSDNAQNTAVTRLRETSRLKNDSESITVKNSYSIFDVVVGQEIPLYMVRAGYWLNIPDLYPRPTYSGTGTTSGDASLNTLFFISTTSYNDSTGVLTITPENSSTLANVVSQAQ